MADKSLTAEERQFLAELELGSDPLAHVPPVPAEVRERIRQMTHARIGRPQGRRPTWQRQAAAAALLLCLGASLLLATSASAQEAVKRLFRVIPGIGLTPLDQTALTLVKPVPVDENGQKGVVQGLVATAEQTTVRINLEAQVDRDRFMQQFHLRRPPRPDASLVLPNGRRLPANRDLFSWRDNGQLWLTLTFPALPRDLPAVTLELSGIDVVTKPVTVILPLTTMAPDSFQPAYPGGQQTEAAGVRLLVHSYGLDGDLIRVELSAQPLTEGLSLSRFAVSDSVYLVDDQNRIYKLNPAETGFGMMQGNETLSLAFDGRPAPGATSLRLMLPTLRGARSGEARLSLAAAQLPATLDLGGYTLKVLNATKLNDQKYRLQIERGPGLESFTTGVEGASHLRANLEQRLTETWLEVEANPTREEFVLLFKSPVVRLSGPWRIDLPLK